ncbi:hypothetical protein LBMAG42_33800 [Deltaproteobacteria bacterium]|nr:hypothetical protein LBMAG42_33800 [Deltaproteobacteria bacterium]
MIHLLLAAPMLNVGGFDVYDNHGRDENVLEVEGGLAGDVVIARAAHMDLRFFGELDATLLQYTTETSEFAASAWRIGAEIGPHWRFGRPPLVGTAEFGFGAHPYLAAPGYASMVVGVGPGSHTMLAVELGSGPTRVTLGLRGAFTVAPDYASATMKLPEEIVNWNWTGMSLRTTLCAGIAFGGPNPGAKP